MYCSSITFLALLALTSNFAISYVYSNQDVIDLQILLKNVSNTLKSLEDELKAHREQKPNDKDCAEEFKSGFCVACNGGDWDQQPMPQDCAVLFKSGQRANGVYNILPLGYAKPIQVYCDMTTAGGGWTVFQRRGDYGNPEDYFTKLWNDYKIGFGDLRKEFWLGNDHISALSRQGSNVLRVDLTTMEGKTAYAMHNTFWVKDESELYEMHITGYSGTAGDSLTRSSGHPFSTKDQGPYAQCAKDYPGGWWFTAHPGCFSCNLNGKNLKGTHSSYCDGVNWYHYMGWYYSLFSEMKIRPAGF